MRFSINATRTFRVYGLVSVPNSFIMTQNARFNVKQQFKNNIANADY